MIEDYDYTIQQLLVFGHMSPEDAENTDFTRLIEIMNSRPRDDRPKSLWDFAADLDKQGRR